MNAITTALAFSLSAIALQAQELIYYKFDEGYGSKVINYAANSPVPAEGTITTNKAGAPPSSWIGGKYGTALAGGSQGPSVYNFVTSGWAPSGLNALTVAAWVRVPPTTATPQTYLWGATPFRSYTISGAMLTTGFNSGQYVTSTGNVLALAKAGGVHVALVLDGTAMTATYYINGVGENPITLTSAVNVTSSGFWVGSDSATRTSATALVNVYDIDEFVLQAKAMTAAEIAALAGSARAAEGKYAGGCGGLTLAGSCARPTVGNLLYQLSLSSSYAGPFSIMVGSNRASLGGIPLPFDLSLVIAGIGTCMIDSSLDLFSTGGAKGVGATNVAFPIPNLPTISGLTIYLQAPALGSPTVLSVSNPFAVGIGN